MKRSHIIAIVIIAVAIAALVSSLGESSSYADLSEALAEPGKEFHVVGTLDRSKPVVYEPSIDPGTTHFAINDLKGQPCEVKLSMAKPADLDRSERVVLIGSMGADGTFHAKNMLLKCPSKYNEENRISG
jgi:cytochrome c-type biogenesis protein CcmE